MKTLDAKAATKRSENIPADVRANKKIVTDFFI